MTWVKCLILVGLAWSGTVAWSDAPCAYVHLENGQMAANKFYTTAWGCVVQITPLNKPNLHYREYYFDERGRFMILNSVSGESYETSVSLRSFFFFPRGGEPSVTRNGDGRFVVKTTSGREVLFAKDFAQVVSFAGITFQESRAVDLDPAHSFQVLTSDQIFLEVPPKVGSSAYLVPGARSTFKSPKGLACTIQNDELFAYQSMLYAEPDLKFGWDRPIEQLLQTRCPGF